MNNRLEKLMYRVGLIDKASGPASKITHQLDQMTNAATMGMAKIGAGAAGLYASGYALNSLLAPAIEMDRAIGEVRSLGVAEAALKSLERTALSTSIRYGTSASDIARSSYDIQSAIAGLQGNELARFTRASAILAKGTKADTSTITDYMGTMYGIFNDTANKMGKAAWVEMLTGQTATAVQMFKTDGAKMAAGFANLGAEATSHGIAMNEQMAIMGQLQSTMSGSESATKYKAFLAGVGKAQGELGLRFTDSHGKLLPMVNILDKLRGKFGDTLDVAESDQLKKAFGSKEATGLIKLLMKDTVGLGRSIDALGDVKGMATAQQMAMDMADPWERMDAAGKAVKTTFGRVLQPVLVPLLNKITDGMAEMQRYADKFPNITKVVGIATLGVFGLVAAVSLFAVVGGIAQLAAAGWTLALMPAVGAMSLLKFGLLTALPAVWGFTAALLANPLTWIVLGVMALVGAIAMAVVYWDKIKAAIMDSGPFKMLGAMLDWVIDKLNLIPGIDIQTGDSTRSYVDETGDTPGESDLVRVDERDLGLSVANQVPAGGLQETINNNGTHIEKLEVNTTGGVNGYQLTDEFRMAGG